MALRGIVVGRDRESRLNGLYDAPQEGRRNINGMWLVILVVAPTTYKPGESFLQDRPRQIIFGNWPLNGLQYSPLFFNIGTLQLQRSQSGPLMYFFPADASIYLIDLSGTSNLIATI